MICHKQIVKRCSLCLIQPINIKISDEDISLCCKHVRNELQKSVVPTESPQGEGHFESSGDKAFLLTRSVTGFRSPCLENWC